jgi:hypothetical protein
MIGFGIGDYADRQGPSIGTYSADELALLHPPAKVEVLSSTGEFHNTKLIRRLDAGGEDYDETYERIAGKQKLPHRGDRVIVLQGGTEHQGKLALLDGENIWLENREDERSVRFSLSDIDGLSKEGDRSWSAGDLVGMDLPSVEHFEMKLEQGVVTYPASELQEVEVKRRKEGRVIGTAVGLVFDFAFIYWVPKIGGGIFSPDSD